MREYWWGLPALLVGVVAMVAGDIAVGRVAANIAFFAVGYGVVVRLGRAATKPGLLVGGVLCAALAATLLGAGIDGVHRWIDIGPASLNVSMLVAPWLLVVIAHLLADGHDALAAALAVIVAVIHALQPDAAQGAAFGIGAMVLLLADRQRRSPILLAAALVLLVLVNVTFIRRDPLEPVPEVEGIVALARESTPVLGVLAVIACALLAVPFLRAAQRTRRSREPLVFAGQWAICTYVLVQLLAPILLDVPVPVMGYGASTVLAFAAAFSAAMAMPRGHRLARRRHPRARPTASASRA